MAIPAPRIPAPSPRYDEKNESAFRQVISETLRKLILVATTAEIAASYYTKAAVDALLTLKANIASPLFTGNPRAPTPSGGDNDTSIATTAFVQGELAGFAPLASPLFTGNPRGPTPAHGDDDTSLATTAFVQDALSGFSTASYIPVSNGDPAAPAFIFSISGAPVLARYNP